MQTVLGVVALVVLGLGFIMVFSKPQTSHYKSGKPFVDPRDEIYRKFPGVM